MFKSEHFSHRSTPEKDLLLTAESKFYIIITIYLLKQYIFDLISRYHTLYVLDLSSKLSYPEMQYQIRDNTLQMLP